MVEHMSNYLKERGGNEMREKHHNHCAGSCHCEKHHHHTEHSEKCSCGNEHAEVSILQIISGAVLFGIGLIIPDSLSLAVFIVAYIVLGYKVVNIAFKNILKGAILDENFLMSISSLAAFFIGSSSEAVAVMLFYNIGEYFQEMAVARSKKSISDLMDICADTANIVRDGKIETVPCEEVKTGDEILIRPGDKVPLDAVVLYGESEIDTSALTGESIPVFVTNGCEILSGYINKGAVLTAKVIKEFNDSTASKIIKMVEIASEKKAPSENFITAFSRVYTPVVVIFSILIAIIPSFVFGDWGEWIRRGCVFLVISCPCALVISIPLTFFASIGAASKKGILVKGGNYIEALSKVKTVVFDKTGTLTKGNFGVSEVIAKEGFLKEEVLRLAARAESISNHPIARSILEVVKIEDEILDVHYAKEIQGFGVEAVIDGEKVIVGNEKLVERLGERYEKYQGDGAVVYVIKGGCHIGSIAISDEIKEDAKEAIDKLKEAGVLKTVMLTGDVKNIAENVGNKLGIYDVKASLLPDEKVEKFKEIAQATDGKTVFVGDGINDAPVLAMADVGIAMGGLGSDAAIEAADVVIMSDEPSKVAEAIRLSKETRKVVVQNIVFALGVKGLFLILGAFGIATMWEAVFSDVGVMILAVLNAMRILKR